MSFLIQNIINNNFSNEEIKQLYKLSNDNFRHKIKKVIIFKNIYNIYLLQSNKIHFLANVITKMKNKINNTNEYNSNIKLIYNIFNISKQYKKLLYKEMFKLKPLEEQIRIRNINNLRVKLRFQNMTNLEKIEFRRLKKERIINKIGLENYNIILRNRYNNWYNNLSNEKKLEIKNKRNLKYKNLPLIKKKILLERHKKYYHRLSHEKKIQYRINKLKKNLL